LLCRSKLAGNTQNEMFDDIQPIDESFYCSLKSTEPMAGVNVQFEATLCGKDRTFRTAVCDYASGSNMTFENMKSFSIYF
jgi:hypothetical protein